MEQSAQSALLLYSCEKNNFGNASSVHWAGRKVKSVVDDARESLAHCLGLSDPNEICFTGSATEAINTALKGFFFHHFQSQKVRFLTSAVEHEATLQTLEFLQTLGATVEVLPVNAKGELDLEQWEKALAASKELTLVSLMAANNETGVIFPWEEVAKLAKRHQAFFHLDAVQAPGKISQFHLSQEVDFASFSAHKMGGPKGVGALVIRKGRTLASLMHGGAQERKRRAGTVNVPGIAAFGAAAAALPKRDLSKILELRNYLEKSVREKISGSHLQGEGAQRLANTSNFLFDGVRGEALLMGLDLEGYAVSSGSACNSGSILPSHVLLAMGFDKAAASSALRVSLGPDNTREEIEGFLEALVSQVERIRVRGKKSSSITA